MINFVNSRADSFRASEAHLTPICLPAFNNTGFLYLYVCFLSSEIAFLLLSAKPDDFYNMCASKERVINSLRGDMLKQIEECVQRQHHTYTVEELGIPDLLHFVY